jgi:hypothetical protein
VGLLSSCVHKVYQKRNLVNNRLYQRQTVRCQSNGNRASSVSDLPAPAAQTSAVGTACSRLPWPAVLPGRPHGPIIYSHPWPVYPSTHPHLLLFSGDGSRTSQPSYSPPRGQPLPCLPRLRVVPFVGLAVVHRPGALGAAWSTWSTNDIHRKWTVRGEADSWVHGRTQGNASLLRAK